MFHILRYLSVRANRCPMFVIAINNFAKNDENTLWSLIWSVVFEVPEILSLVSHFKGAENPSNFEITKLQINDCTLNKLTGIGSNHAFNLGLNGWVSHIEVTLLPNVCCCDLLSIKWWFISAMSLKWCTERIANIWYLISQWGPQKKKSQ